VIGVDPATLRRALNGLDDPGGSSQGKKFRPLHGPENGPSGGCDPENPDRTQTKFA